MSFNRVMLTELDLDNLRSDLKLMSLARETKVNFITPKAFSDGREFEKTYKSTLPFPRQNDFNLDSMVLIRDDPLPNCTKTVILKARQSGLKTISDTYHDIGIRALYYSFTPKKETNMSQDLIQAIRVISGTEQKDELSRFEQMPANIKEAMTRKMAARQQEASEKIADQLITLLDSAAGHKIRYLQLSRTLRAQMNTAISNVKRFHAAEQLANAGNFAPLVLVVHGTSGFTVDEIKKIEQDLEDQITKDAASPKITVTTRKRST